jgi:NAD(P)-dependent dehydrogenase (short-subunit alcohol dehydrogenase family)
MHDGEGHIMSFEGKVALVAGAGGGMGLNIANDLIAGGAHVALADLKPQPDDIHGGPGRSYYSRGDLSDEVFVSNIVKECVDTFGRLDYLVNTLGLLLFGVDKSVVDMDLAVWDRVMNANLKSFMLTSRHAIPAMRASGGGAIVHFSSTQALRGDAKAQDAYGASKGAVLSLSKSIAIQFASDGIRSNAILPGGTMSPMQERWKDMEEEVAKSIPIGRLGTTQDQANACLFLLSDKASYITGAELVVDGGATASV